MQWLTREWKNGGLSDAEFHERMDAEQRHRAKVLPLLPVDLQTLSGELIDGRARSLHDGRIMAWKPELPVRLVLQVVCGDLQRGYERLTLEYDDAERVCPIKCVRFVVRTRAAVLPTV